MEISFSWIAAKSDGNFSHLTPLLILENTEKYGMAIAMLQDAVNILSLVYYIYIYYSVYKTLHKVL